MFAWFIHEIMDDFMPVVKKDRGDYLYTGWMVTDMQSERINAVNERKEEIGFSGRTAAYRSSIMFRRKLIRASPSNMKRYRPVTAD